MEDAEIIDLYWQRDQRAIDETHGKYGGFLAGIAWNILRSHSDAEECVNDTYLRTWNAIPPARPSAFRAWLGRIVRNLSLKKLRANSALKRSSRFEVSLSELEDCISAHSLDEQLAAGELSAQINAFLAALRRDDRVMFVRRYWFAQPLSEIADAFGTTENNVSVRLGRIRRKLHTYLERKEVTL